MSELALKLMANEELKNLATREKAKQTQKAIEKETLK